MYLFLQLLLFLTIYSRPVYSTVTVYVDSNSSPTNGTSCGTVTSPCVEFDDGLDVIQNMLKDHNIFDLSITMIIEEGNYTHNSLINGIFNEVSDLTIIGQTNDTDILTTVYCEGQSGFSFIKSFDIKLYGIIFEGCGQLQNSTSYNSSSDSFSLFYAGLYFLYCRNINMTLISVINSQATGIVLYNIIGTTNILQYITVSNNTFSNDSQYSNGGGLYIEYSYCVPLAGGIDCLLNGITNIDTTFTGDSYFMISNSTFSDNIANISTFSNDTYILPHEQYHSAFGRGGGLSVFYKGTTANGLITIDTCIFDNNQGLWGGGLLVEFQDGAYSNQFIVRSSRFHGNSLYYNDIKHEGTGGGGARVGYVFFEQSVHDNRVVFDSCNFTDNRAYFGGGLSFYSSLLEQNIENKPNTLEINTCTFTVNTGHLGAAVDIGLWHPSINGTSPYIYIMDCNFINNTAQHTTGLVGIGAVYIDSLPITFKGNVTFDSNSGSALVVTGSYITVGSNTGLYFINNTGRNGGAIALLGDTFILINDNTRLHFVDNSAQYKGGAIYSFRSGQRDLLSSQNCFIRYHDIKIHPQDWSARFYFQNNIILSHGKILNSIYTPTLVSCFWGGNYGVSLTNDDTFKQVFCWNTSIWQYYDINNTLSNCQDHIMTAPSTYSIFQHTYTTIPGKLFDLNILLIDELERNITDATLVASMTDNNNASFLGQSTTTTTNTTTTATNTDSENSFQYYFISQKEMTLLGKPNTSVSVRLETRNPVIIPNYITVTFKPCPPGFISNDNSSSKCTCPQGDYNGYINCHPLRYVIKIKKASWIGQINNTGDYLVGLSPYVTSSDNSSYITLPEDPSQLSHTLCGELQRTGVLCGECIHGYGVDINSENFACVNCPSKYVHYHWFLYILTEFLPATLFFAFVFIFSMTITTGPLNSYILFAQLITTCLDIDADGMIPLDNVASTMGLSYKKMEHVYFIPYNIWNLNFFRSLFPQFCLSPHLSTVHIYCIGYITAVYPLILLLIFAFILFLYNRGFRCVVRAVRPFHNCISRFRQLTNSHQSIPGGVAVFILISYTKIAHYSLFLLTPIPLLYANGSTAKTVFYPDGSIEWGKDESFLYIVLAACMLCTFVLLPPLILFYPTLLRIIERLSCWRLHLGKLYPPPKVQVFLDEFHGCYKDGSDEGIDCRWFASFYFCLRIILYSAYSTSNTWYSDYTIMSVLFLFSAFLVALFQPYRKAWINQLDISMYLLLAAITTLSQYNLQTLWVGESELEKWPFLLQYILILLPLFYCIAYYGVVITSRTKMRCSSFVKRKYHYPKMKRKLIQIERQQSGEYITGASDDNHNTLLEDSTHVPEFLDYVTARDHSHSFPKRVRLFDVNRTQSTTNRRDYLDEFKSGESSPLLTASSNETSSDDDDNNNTNLTINSEGLFSENDYQTAYSTGNSDNDGTAVASTTVYLP